MKGNVVVLVYYGSTGVQFYKYSQLIKILSKMLRTKKKMVTWDTEKLL